MRKITALSLALTLIIAISFAGCRSNTADTSSAEITNAAAQAEKNSINVLYCASDSFNPYSAATKLNRELATLIFEPLVRLDNNFTPVYRLASSVTVEGARCTAVLRDAVFSDGSAVTAGDVVYSFNLAKGSATEYASQLYEAASATAADSKTVVFNLIKYDPYFVNVLDFPIIKSGSEKQTDADSVALPPTGCGRYSVGETRDKLLINDNFFGEKGSITTINLINAPDYESVSHYVEIGAADIYYSDISDGTLSRMSGNKTNINLNNIVYIGVNHTYGALSSPYMRYAISSALDRKKICAEAFYSNAVAATGFFNPVWKDVKSVQNIQTTADKEITVENLEKIGYNSLDSSGVRVGAGGRLSFTLLVNSENRTRVNAARLIAENLGAVGISVSVVERPYAEYAAALAAGDFQLYLAEVKITDNMDISNLVVPGGSTAYGIVLPAAEQSEDGSEAEKPAGTADIINGFYGGTNTINDVAMILQTEMPIIPVCYRTGALFRNKGIGNAKGSSHDDVFYSIESFTIKK